MLDLGALSDRLDLVYSLLNETVNDAPDAAVEALEIARTDVRAALLAQEDRRWSLGNRVNVEGHGAARIMRIDGGHLMARVRYEEPDSDGEFGDAPFHWLTKIEEEAPILTLEAARVKYLGVRVRVQGRGLGYVQNICIDESKVLDCLTVQVDGDRDQFIARCDYVTIIEPGQEELPVGVYKVDLSSADLAQAGPLSVPPDDALESTYRAPGVHRSAQTPKRDHSTPEGLALAIIDDLDAYLDSFGVIKQYPAATETLNRRFSTIEQIIRQAIDALGGL
jgi:hypothetical protein